MPATTHRVSRIKISATKQMPMIAAKVGGCVSLGQGVPSFSPPPHVLAAVCQALTEDPAVHRYSLQPGDLRLRAAIAGQLRRERGLTVDPETEVAVFAGGMEALLCAMLAVVEEGDEVILPSPCYPSHVEQVLLAGGRPVFVPLDPATFALDPADLARAVGPRTKAIIVTSPSNPTGCLLSESALRAVADLALAHDLFIVSDETYDVLVYDDPVPSRLTSLPTLADIRDRLILVFSCSKRYALTGWRVGYAVAPAKLLHDMLKVHDCATICAPAPAQVAALAALTGPQEPFQAFVTELAARRDLTCERLDRLADFFTYVRPRGAFYVMARYRFSSEPSHDLAVRLIKEAQVITIPGGAFGPGGEGALRLSFGGSREELTEAFDRIERWLRK